MKKLLLLSILILGGTAHATWDVTTPAGSESKSLGDDRIRALKVDISTALNQDGKFPGADTSNPRFHVTLTSGTSGSRPTGNNLSVGRLYLNTTLGALERWTGSSWVQYDLTPSTSINSTDISTDAIGAGLWGGAGDPLRLAYSTTYFTVAPGSITINNLSISTGALGTASVTSAKLAPNLVLVGTFTAPNQTYFYATNSAEDVDQTGDGTVVTVDYNNEESDVSAVFGSDTFTVPAAGTYQLISTVRYDDTAGGNSCSAFLSASTTGSLGSTGRQGNNPDTLQPIYVGPLVKGETVTVQFQCSGGAKVVDVTGGLFQGTLLH